MTTMLTPAEVAELLKVSYDTALNFIKKSGLPYTKVGRQYRIKKDVLDSVLSDDTAVTVTFDE